MVFACKKCKKCFRKDTREWDETDEYCPYCDNHFVIPAKTPENKRKVVIELEGDDGLIIDERMKQKPKELPKNGPEIEFIPHFK